MNLGQLGCSIEDRDDLCSDEMYMTQRWYLADCSHWFDSCLQRIFQSPVKEPPIMMKPDYDLQLRHKFRFEFNLGLTNCGFAGFIDISAQ